MESALVEALQSGHLAGAALDVFDTIPILEAHPYWQMEQVIITPHVAGTSDRIFARVFLLAVENTRRYAAGEPMLSVVDTARGY